MIGFWIVAGLLILAALAILLRPLIRQKRPGAEDEEPVAALFRRQLGAVDEELAQGRLTPDQAAAARTEITRRLLAAAARESETAAAAPGGPAETSWRVGAAIGIAALLPAAAIATYFAVGSPAAIDRSADLAAAAPHGAAELAAAADRIKAHLSQKPNDLEGWILLGRTLASLSRFADARAAYARAIALAPAETRLHAELGEVLVLAAQGTVSPAAAAEFAKAADDPRSRYYIAEAALQHGDAASAKQQLRALLAGAPADAPWRQAVADRLAELSPGEQSAGEEPAGEQAMGAQAAAQAPGPSAQDVAAAQAMTPDQRQAMIRAMVARLAARLDQHPDDRAGWERLAHAYEVLGEPDKAQAARARAAASGAPAPASPEMAQTVPETTQAPPGDAPGMAQAAPATAPTPPSDAPGWLERARSDQGLGRTAEALAALKQGNAHFPGNLPLLEAYMKALAAGLKDDKPTPEFTGVATQIHALDADQPDALWYLGLAAAADGDRFRAADYWTKLVALLPPGGAQRSLVQHRLDALR